MRPRGRPRMSLWRVLGSLAVSLVLGACAAYQVPPLSTSHPANPAAAAPARPRSQTLAYSKSDVLSGRAATSSAVTSSESAPPDAAPSAPSTVVGEGEVVATVPGSGQIVVDHEEIKGFMEAMTMGYRVDPPSLLAGLSAGDKVRFTIDVTRRAIVRIEKLP